jgi:hypothetical protein
VPCYEGFQGPLIRMDSLQYLDVSGWEQNAVVATWNDNKLLDRMKDCTQSHKVNAEKVPEISPQLLHLTYLPVHYSVGIVFDTI